MRQFTQHLVSFLKNEDGPTAVEYAVMLALIIVVCITAITTLGTNANNTFSYIGQRIGSTGSNEDTTCAFRRLRHCHSRLQVSFKRMKGFSHASVRAALSQLPEE